MSSIITFALGADVEHSSRPFRATSPCSYSARVRPQTFPSRAHLWYSGGRVQPTRVRFLLSAPTETEKLRRGLLICLFFIIIVLLLESLHLHNIVRPILRLQLFSLDVLPTFYSAPGISPIPSSEKQ